MSGGEQLRDFLAVTDIAKYIEVLARSQRDLGVINICSGEPIAVRDLVEGWIQQNRWNIRINLGHYPYQDYEPMGFWGDNSKLKRTVSELRVAPST